MNKIAEKAEVEFKEKRGKKDKFCMQEFLGIRESVRGLGFAVPCFFFVIFKLRVIPQVDSMLLN